MKKITVLGCGLVGGPMALDLAEEKEFQVRAVDIDPRKLERMRQSHLQTIQSDISRPENVRKLAIESDLVLSAVPGFLGYQTLAAVIDAGRPLVDIAFFPEDPMNLQESALKKGVIAVIDAGVAPGLSHIFAGRACSLLEEPQSLAIYVGGLPKNRLWPFEYKAVFSPSDVIEEYCRPARLKENGRIIEKEALSEPELIDFDPVGTLEAFNTDGLRTLLHTLPIPEMKEKTLRYPGHREKMLLLRKTGFFSTDEVDIKGTKLRPLDLTSKLLFSQWRLEPGEPDFTVMRVEVTGTRNGALCRMAYELYDELDPGSGIHSMARTTGFTAAVTARLLLNRGFTRPGICPPEYLGMNQDAYRFILDGLKRRGITLKESEG